MRAGTERFKVLYYFMNEEISIVEIELINIPNDTSKDKKFHWLRYIPRTKELTKLTFKTMGEEIVNGNNINSRVFDEAELRFDKAFGKYSDSANSFIIMNAKTDKVPQGLLDSINESKFSSLN